MVLRRLHCPSCGRTWMVMAGDLNRACPGCGSAGEPAETDTDARFCACGCGASLAGLRADAKYHSEACKKRSERARRRDKAGTDGPTDCERLLTALRDRGTTGIHSHEIRKLGISGNPSQRVTELEEQGFTIDKQREHKGRRPGTRYTLLAEPETAGAGVGASGAGPGDPGAPDAGGDSPAVPAEPAREPARLFEPAVPSPYDPISEAA